MPDTQAAELNVEIIADQQSWSNMSRASWERWIQLIFQVKVQYSQVNSGNFMRLVPFGNYFADLQDMVVCLASASTLPTPYGMTQCRCAMRPARVQWLRIAAGLLPFTGLCVEKLHMLERRGGFL